jgi:hypothetical protein
VKSSFIETLVQGGNEIEGSASVAVLEESADELAQSSVPSTEPGLPLTGFQLLVMLSVGLGLIVTGVVLLGRAVGDGPRAARRAASTSRSVREWYATARRASKRWRFGFRS